MYGLIGYLTDHCCRESSVSCAPVATGKTGVAKKLPAAAPRQRRTPRV
jgi:hypothetical protein